MRTGNRSFAALDECAAAGARVREATSVVDPARVARVPGRLSEVEREAALAGLELLVRASGEEMRAPARKA